MSNRQICLIFWEFIGLLTGCIFIEGFAHCFSAGWLSWFGNSLVLFVLYRQRATLQPTDFLTLNLAISDASISVFGYSRGILEIFNIFRDNGYLITWIWTCQVKTYESDSIKNHKYYSFFVIKTSLSLNLSGFQF